MLCYTAVILLFSFVRCTHAGASEEFTDTYFDIRCKSQRELVDLLCRKKCIRSERVKNVMLHVDRKFYAPYTPYVDDAKVYKAFGRIDSPPNMIAFTLETLKYHLVADKKVLDVGSCSGYLTMCMALMVGKFGSVLGVEQKESLVNYAIKNMDNDKWTLKRVGVVYFEVGRVIDLAPRYGPFDVIHVAIPSPRVPQVLFDQLKNGGRMMIAIGNQSLQHFKEISLYDKDQYGNITLTKLKGKFIMHFLLW